MEYNAMFLFPQIKKAIELIKIYIERQGITAHCMYWRDAIRFFSNFFPSKTRSKRAQFCHESLQLVLSSIIKLFLFLQQIKSFFRLVSRYLSNQLCLPTPSPLEFSTLLLKYRAELIWPGLWLQSQPLSNNALSFMLLKSIHRQNAIASLSYPSLVHTLLSALWLAPNLSLLP